MGSRKETHSLTEEIIGCIIRVHRILGPGFLEGVYHRALTLELRASGFHVEVEKEILIFYQGQMVGRHLLDLVVDRKILIELKAVEAFNKAHYAQIRSYLKASRLPTGILVNYSQAVTDFRRLDANAKVLPALHPSPLPLPDPTTAEPPETAGETCGARINTGQ